MPRISRVDDGRIPLSASRTWGTCTVHHWDRIDARGVATPVTDSVALRLTRRDDPTQAVVVLIPEAWIADVSVDLWSLVRRKAAAAWGWRRRRLRAASR